MKNDAYITKKCPVQFWDFVMIEDDLWYAASGFNGLFRADLKSKISKFVGYFPGESNNAADLYGGVCRWRDKLIFAPFVANRIAAYDIVKNQFETYTIPAFERNTKYPFPYFMGIAAVQDSIFFFGNIHPVIMQLNMITGEVKLHLKWYKDFEQCGKDPATFLFDRHVLRRDAYLYATSRQNNVMLKLNTKNCRVEFVEIGDRSARYSALAFGEDQLWVIDQIHNELLCFSVNSQKTQKIVSLPGEAGNYDIAFCNGCLWIFSKRFSNTISAYDMVYNPERNHLEILNLKQMHDGYGVVFAKAEGEYVYCMYPDSNEIYKMHLVNDELIIHKLELEYSNALYDTVYESGMIDGVFHEAGSAKLCNTHTCIQRNMNTFLKYVLYEEKATYPQYLGKQIGDNIWGLTTGGIRSHGE